MLRLVALFLASVLPVAAETYSLFQVGTQYTTPVGLNNAGTITGVFNDTGDASIQSFLRTADGTITRFPSGSAIYATAINDLGTVTGTSDVNHGFLRSSSGVFTIFDVPGAAMTLPYSINANGDVTGIYRDLPSSRNRGFIRNSAGVFTTFDVPGIRDIWPMSINGAGQVAGVSVPAIPLVTPKGFFRDSNGTITTFDMPRSFVGEKLAAAAFLNNAGEIAGFVEDHFPCGFACESVVSVGFLLQPGGTPERITFPGSIATHVNGINSSAQLVGSYGTSAKTIAFQWDATRGFQTLSVPGAAGATTANAINDSGTIAGVVTTSAGIFAYVRVPKAALPALQGFADL